MTIRTRQVRIKVSSGVFEVLALRGKRLKIAAFTLCENNVAGFTVIGLYRLARGSFVFLVVATETTQPVLMSDIVRVNAPVGLSIRENRLGIEALHLGNRRRRPDRWPTP